MKIERPYGSVEPIYFPLWAPDGSALITGVTIDAGDLTLVQDGVDAGDAGGAFAEVGALGLYKYTPAAGELECKQAKLVLVDGEAICLDFVLIIETYGDVNALHTQEVIDPTQLVADIVAACFARAFHAKMGSLTFEEITALAFCFLAGKASGMDTNAPAFRNVLDSANAATAVTDDDGNRSAVTLNPANVR